MRKGDRVQIYLPATQKHGVSQFHARTGTLSYRSDVGKRWFVQLDGDKEGTCVEFLPSEMVGLANQALSRPKVLVGKTKKKVVGGSR